MAMENSARAQPNSSAIGIWKTPKDARIENATKMTAQPAIRTGDIRGCDLLMCDSLSAGGAEGQIAILDSVSHTW
jgi:hypothetical protein